MNRLKILSQSAVRSLAFAAALTALGGSGAALAQPSNGGHAKLALAGLPAADIERRFGHPDEVRKDTTGRDVWHYGPSTVFLTDGKVSAWVDQGELAKRESASAMKPSASKHSDDLRDEWINPWTPRK